MSTEGAGSGEETLLSGSPTTNNKVKFLCSHGGKILPRPADGNLKYVGGETRIISITRDINFSELMKKLSNISDGEIILKYQLIPEELDALISVKSDEDLRHMMDEYDRHESAGTPKLRAFLFPTSPMVIENQMGSMEPFEQRYIDAINGIIRPPSTAPSMIKPITASHPSSYSISSACSSPRSPESCTTDNANHEATMVLNNYQNGRIHLQRVKSLPSINVQNNGNHHMHQHHHHHHNNWHGGCQPNKPPLDPHRSGGPERLIAVRSVGRADSFKYQVDNVPHYLYPATRFNKENSLYNKCTHLEEYGAYVDRRMESFPASRSVPDSPSLPRSPR